MAQFPGGIEITPAASMLGPSINNAAALYGQLQQLKTQREELDNKKLEARYDMGIKLVTDPKLPASVKAKAYNNAVRPYLEKLNPGSGVNLSEDDFKGGDVQSLIDEITPIFGSDKFSKEEKMRLASVPFAKFQSRFGLNKEASDTLMRGFGIPNPASSKESNDDIDALRKEFTSLPQIKDFQTVSSSFQKIRSGVKQNSAAGDLSLIFSYMKLLDPGSVVRESEFANAQNAAGVPDRIRAQYNNVVRGERLTGNQRQDFFQTAKSIYASQERYIKAIEDQYVSTAKSRGIDPTNVLLNLRAPEEPDPETTSQPTPQSEPTQAPPSNIVTPDIARSLLNEAGGDRNKARALAKRRGMRF